MLGAIADDFTGATDLATMLRRSGHRVSVVIEDGALPTSATGRIDAVVVALKTRTAPVADAVYSSLTALDRLRSWGADRIYVKYCSTFDSTDEGNIGPVLDALQDALSAKQAVVVPSLPANGRTVYQGHLFVEDELLEHSSMRDHPLTPMTRSRVSELLRPQTAREIAEVRWLTVTQGEQAVRAALRSTSARYVVVDAICDSDLATIAAATSDEVLVSGGSGLAIGIPGPNLRDDLWVSPPTGRRAVLCGSVSRASLTQIANAAHHQPVRGININAAANDLDSEVDRLVAWFMEQDAEAIPVICAARSRDDVLDDVRGTRGADLVESVLASVAKRIVGLLQVTSMLVAGGESSGAIVRALGIETLHIGPEVAPGVCWSSCTANHTPIALALKSGNFGNPELFTAAWKELR